jgi:hypothetical protein
MDTFLHNVCSDRDITKAVYITVKTIEKVWFSTKTVQVTDKCFVRQFSY